ncbi:RRAD and GEM like GTPase 2 [Phyllostomus discolor]|uniref:RRAD and GEM like GTPase 2 n=1 Tax=Phyllostomus discolor TaxID=89673 RepID=A0A834BQX7_9CHIR|nr:RRAD and GEM like GTPase 2 [Phyllostomus discolor]
MHSDLDADMDTDTETTALCPSGNHQASPPGTPTPEANATLLKKQDKLLAELDRSEPPSAPGAPRRRGSMPVPYKHQLRRAQAVDELDWPPQASSSGSSDSLGSGEGALTQKDSIFKVMLVGESGVGKSTLAGTFGGLQGDNALSRRRHGDLGRHGDHSLSLTPRLAPPRPAPPLSGFLCEDGLGNQKLPERRV